MQLPINTTSEHVIRAMEILLIDPNFEMLCNIVKQNDMELLKSSIITGKDPSTKEKLTTEQTEEMRYKLGVFEEFIEMPKTILESIKSITAHVEDRESLDPYHTTETLKA